MAKAPKKSAPEKSAPEPVEMVTVQCICNNVHLGNGVVLKASRKTDRDNWSNGDRAEVKRSLADQLVEAKQVKIVG